MVSAVVKAGSRRVARAPRWFATAVLLDIVHTVLLLFVLGAFLLSALTSLQEISGLASTLPTPSLDSPGALAETQQLSAQILEGYGVLTALFWQLYAWIVGFGLVLGGLATYATVKLFSSPPLWRFWRRYGLVYLLWNIPAILFLWLSLWLGSISLAGTISLSPSVIAWLQGSLLLALLYFVLPSLLMSGRKKPIGALRECWRLRRNVLPGYLWAALIVVVAALISRLLWALSSTLGLLALLALALPALSFGRVLVGTRLWT